MLQTASLSQQAMFPIPKHNTLSLSIFHTSSSIPQARATRVCCTITTATRERFVVEIIVIAVASTHFQIANIRIVNGRQSDIRSKERQGLYRSLILSFLFGIMCHHVIVKSFACNRQMIFVNTRRVVDNTGKRRGSHLPFSVAVAYRHQLQWLACGSQSP